MPTLNNLNDKPKPGPKLEKLNLNNDVKPIDLTSEIKDKSVNPKVVPVDLTKDIKDINLYPPVIPAKQDKLLNVNSIPIINNEPIKGKNVNKPLASTEPVTSIGSIDTTHKTSAITPLGEITKTLPKDKEPSLNLGNVNPKTK